MRPRAPIEWRAIRGRLADSFYHLPYAHARLQTATSELAKAKTALKKARADVARHDRHIHALNHRFAGRKVIVRYGTALARATRRSNGSYEFSPSGTGDQLGQSDGRTGLIQGWSDFCYQDTGYQIVALIVTFDDGFGTYAIIPEDCTIEISGPSRE
jgi:hypothetical protein